MKIQRIFRKYFIALICLALIASPAPAMAKKSQHLEIKNGNYIDWIVTIDRLASSGCNEAESILAALNAEEKNISQDLKKAFQLAEVAAENGYVEAHTLLGSFYANGYGTEKNISKALEHYRTATKLGSPFAALYLGLIYYQGNEVPQNYDEAVRLFRIAAKHNLALSQSILGETYNYGRGVEVNKKIAAHWYRKASERGYAPAQNELGHLYALGDGVYRDDVEAVKWYRKAAIQGLPIAQYNLGWHYEKGLGVPEDPVLARHWYEKAAEGNFFIATMRLNVLDDKERSNKSNSQSFQAFTDKRGNKVSFINHLAGKYADGSGGKQDYQKALEFYELAAEMVEPDAEFKIGRLYEKGMGAEPDYAQAIKWYRSAAEKEYAPAEYKLGVVYTYGYGIDVDLKLAEHWFAKSESHGYAPATKALEILRKSIALKKATSNYETGRQEMLDGHLSKASRYLMLAIKENPDFVLAYATLGDLLNRQRKHNEAIKILQKAAKMAISSPSGLRAYIYNNLGFSYENEKNYKKALEQYRIALEIDPENSFAQEKLNQVPEKVLE